MTKTLSFILLSTSLLLSCGKSGESGGLKNSIARNPALEGQRDEGSYRAILRPMNNQLSGFLPSGVAEITIAQDNVQVKTLLDDDARVIHIQSVHQGTVCPTSRHDKNNDGLVDVAEVAAAAGEVLFPLDSNLNSEAEGAGLYPLGGAFTYVENASLAKLASDTKARTGEDLNLSGRVVLIHGVSGATKMPETVATKGTYSRQASIPIACGILQRIK